MGTKVETQQETKRRGGAGRNGLTLDQAVNGDAGSNILSLQALMDEVTAARTALSGIDSGADDRRRFRERESELRAEFATLHRARIKAEGIPGEAAEKQRAAIAEAIVKNRAERDDLALALTDAGDDGARKEAIKALQNARNSLNTRYALLGRMVVSSEIVRATFETAYNVTLPAPQADADDSEESSEEAPAEAPKKRGRPKKNA